MLEKSNSQYDSFLFWRQPIPALNLSELDGLGLVDGKSDNSSHGKERTGNINEEGELSEYTSFTYWRSPIADIDSFLADLNLLL